MWAADGIYSGIFFVCADGEPDKGVCHVDSFVTN
jgi:hypothetical protein